jgi:hypothetical protein
LLQLVCAEKGEFSEEKAKSLYYQQVASLHNGRLSEVERTRGDARTRGDGVGIASGRTPFPGNLARRVASHRELLVNVVDGYVQRRAWRLSGRARVQLACQLGDKFQVAPAFAYGV